MIPAIKKCVSCLLGWAAKWLRHCSGTSGVLILVASGGTLMHSGALLICDSHFEIHIE